MMSRKFPAQPFKDKKFCNDFYKLMVRNRVLEERLIKMAKSSDGFFWIGGPGEESTNIALGLQVNKGHGLEHDFLHLHYRSNGVAMAMGQPMVDFIRQMKCVSTDPFSGGRNFVSHICKKEWNIVPVTSTIETQFAVAPGTARAQKRLHSQGNEAGITIVIGGDAGTAEGDFASCLVWSSRPDEELPILMIVTNNQYGISTPACTQHGDKHIADRAKAFGIKSTRADGLSPEKAWSAISEALEYVRETRKPYLLEIMVSRLYGHSSSSGANLVENEEDPITSFEKKLVKNEWLNKTQIEKIWNDALNEAAEAIATARLEPMPEASSVLDHSFADNQKAGLPGRDF